MSEIRNMPKISIITVCLNSEKTIEQTIQSVIGQKYPDLEYIVIDGGSSDTTIKIIEKHKKNINYFISESDKGISDAFNKGINRATGELIGIVSSDDYLPQDSLQTVAEVWLSNPEADVIYGNSIVREIGNKKTYIVKPDKDFQAIWKRQPLKHSAMYISRKTYLKFGMYDLKYHLSMDYEMTLRLYLKGANFVYTNQVIGAFCIGGINTRNFIKTMAEVRDISMQYGYSRSKAYCWFYIKLIKLYFKRQLYNFHLFPLINLYRNFSSRFQKNSNI